MLSIGGHRDTWILLFFPLDMSRLLIENHLELYRMGLNYRKRAIDKIKVLHSDDRRSLLFQLTIEQLKAEDEIKRGVFPVYWD